jgi:EmrB/QacA subfamily drug resistance transporter
MNIDPNELKTAAAESAVQPVDTKEATGFMKWLPLLVMSLALTIIILDTTILNVTLRTIVVDLHTTLQKIQWVITAYSLMLAAFTITGGRLGDLFGRKKMFVTGAIIFAIGSFMTSVAQSVGFMIWGEAIIEGIGACLMLPATLSLLRSNYKGRDLQVAFGIWGGIVAGAAALGPVIGGWFTTNYTWRWAFRVNVFVAAVLVIASVFISEYRDNKEKPTIDFAGVFLSALGMLSLVFGFIQASTYGWWKALSPLVILSHVINFGGVSATPIFIALGAIILGLFFMWEGHVEKAGRTPLVSLKLFENKTFMTGSGVSAILAMGQAGLSFAVPIYLQSVLKLDPLHTGLAMIPMTAVILISAPASAWISKFITPKRIIQLGILLDVVGFIVLRQSLYVGAGPLTLAPGFVLFGLGLGFMIAQASNLTLSAVSVEQSGEASGVNSTFRSLGQTLGSAVIGAILISALGANLISGINASSQIPANIKPAITQAAMSESTNVEFGAPLSVGSAQLPTNIANEITTISNQATVTSSKTALSYGTIFILVAFILSFQLPAGEVTEDKPSIPKAIVA